MPQIVVMGVSGCGKSSVGAALATVLSGEFIDADDYHPQCNIDLMSRGTPLTDNDRVPWLHTLQRLLQAHSKNTPTHYLVVACSALKRSYRETLQTGAADTLFVHLHAPYSVIWDRLVARQGHFAHSDILKSQYEALDLDHPTAATSTTNPTAARDGDGCVATCTDRDEACTDRKGACTDRDWACAGPGINVYPVDVSTLQVCEIVSDVGQCLGQTYGVAING
ncbi:shikimate kinase [Sphaeroforma arctica JP610]|uniref:Gluconokinase n=1 Tax=Sphaeroforma arctica JP610 TaxID=667725 RepID=A0A0L0FKX8_9EUKA|nr:shikimate kinase [Sphaeroforma arctica JP610]KNC76663.1 shikimate kinase [Sphaeroforma arctica JP610]|eukprot:XP_014150565.1 shikimate kinase [Sphaeroforma arctica JP610]